MKQISLFNSCTVAVVGHRCASAPPPMENVAALGRPTPRGRLTIHRPRIASPLHFVGSALHITLKATSRLRQRTSLATIQMEEGLRANQIHIDAANAEATRLAAERAAQPGGPHPGDRAGAGAEASPPAIDTGETNVSTDKSTPSVAAGPEPAQTPAAAPPESGTIAPPEPVYIESSTQKLKVPCISAM